MRNQKGISLFLGEMRWDGEEILGEFGEWMGEKRRAQSYLNLMPVP
jgi:hypothetical protein